ncbi:hypothetical protein Terro_0508 [Terriglobus roseus DSM 18391]|uniref:DinB family protein n=1 Tax=Terriglobus roseus (strain DSM 18391 / NRRL B-41598 / KBS 63) TaxID=926566 RepID=I3ZC81_TERRK|nr:DinB family protein [Terriglobus roseus]AFL86849.1 hypothetical protein Terro_0508 [Terriglobus roseus DSM 18391]
MSLPGMTGDELLAWAERTSAGWRDFTAAYPHVLLLPCDIQGTHTVGELLQHIVAVELRYAERLHSFPETPYDDVPFDTADVIFATHHRAVALMRALEDRNPEFWETPIQFVTRRGGELRVSRRTVYLHTLLHSIRHYAQLATLVRQAGVSTDWPMDYLLMGVLPNL